MPRMDAAIYAAHMDSVLKLARREGGVSRPDLIRELQVSRPVADGLIKKCGLELDRKKGRTEYFSSPNVTGPDVKASTPAEPVEPAPIPPEVKKVAVPVTDEIEPEELDLDVLADLDAKIIDTRNTIHKHAASAGKALGEWATQSSLVDVMKARLTTLLEERVKLSS